MLQTKEQLAAALVARGLFTALEFQKFAETLTATPSRASAAGIIAVLVERQKLTQFQADEVLHERTTPLVLDDYLLLDRLGAGNMGEVFKALHRRLERVVALKMVAANLTRSDVAVRRFQREVKAAARLSHPNIVTTYDAGEMAGHHYLVMEYVDGTDLDKLKDGERLPVDRALNLILQAAEGLEYAHANGVIHRDIKPANLLVDRNDRLRILDLGIARISQSLADDDGLTRTGYVMGTVDYMAPEQGFDIKHVDERCDIYSLGCTLYRLLTGYVMYGGDTFLERARRHENDPIPALRDRCPELPIELERFYRRMVAKKPKDRYPTMTAVKEALRHVQRCLAGGSAERAGGPWWQPGFLGLWKKPAPPKRRRTKSLTATMQADDPVDEPSFESRTSSQARTHERVGVNTLIPDDQPQSQFHDTRSDAMEPSSGTTPEPWAKSSARAKMAAHARRRRMLVTTSVLLFGLLALAASFAAGLVGPQKLKDWLLASQRPENVPEINQPAVADARRIDAEKPITPGGNEPHVSPSGVIEASFVSPIPLSIIEPPSDFVASSLPEVLATRLISVTNVESPASVPASLITVRLPDVDQPQFVSLTREQENVPPASIAKLRFSERAPELPSPVVSYLPTSKFQVTRLPLVRHVVLPSPPATATASATTQAAKPPPAAVAKSPAPSPANRSAVTPQNSTPNNQPQRDRGGIGAGILRGILRGRR